MATELIMRMQAVQSQNQSDVLYGRHTVEQTAKVEEQHHRRGLQKAGGLLSMRRMVVEVEAVASFLLAQSVEEPLRPCKRP